VGQGFVVLGAVRAAARSFDYADAARLCSATAGFELDIGFRMGKTSA